jgi:hypothetical protein
MGWALSEAKSVGRRATFQNLGPVHENLTYRPRGTLGGRLDC